jgi:hypothetical protein
MQASVWISRDNKDNAILAQPEKFRQSALTLCVRHRRLIVAADPPVPPHAAP